MALNRLAKMPKKTDSFRCISIFCNKGGEGKTTSAVMFGTILAAKGYKVLLIDNDGQGNLSDFNGAPLIPQPGVVRTENLYWDINTNSPKMEDKINIPLLIAAIQESEIGYGYIESSKLLDKVIPQIANENLKFTMWRIMQTIKSSFDFCIIDSPCKTDILSVNSIIAADDVIITIATEADTEKTLTNNIDLFNDFKKEYNVDVNIDRVIPVKIKSSSHVKYILPTIEEFSKTGYQSKITSDYIKHSADIESCMLAREERIKVMSSNPKRGSEAIMAYFKVVEEYLSDHGISDNNFPKILPFNGVEGVVRHKIIYEQKDFFKEAVISIHSFLNSETIKNRVGLEPFNSNDIYKKYRIVIYMTDKNGKKYSNKAAREMIEKYLEHYDKKMKYVFSIKEDEFFDPKEEMED